MTRASCRAEFLEPSPDLFVRDLNIGAKLLERSIASLLARRLRDEIAEKRVLMV